MKPSVDSAGGHHLLKHTAPSIERVVECFDGAPVKEISKLIMRMGQRELQAKFNAVYGTVTRSNNNDWLRRKLFESIGVKSSNKSKSAAKRDNKIGPAKANRVLKVTKPATSRSSWSSPEDSTAPYSVAPPESPATVTHGDGQAQTPFGPQVSPLLATQPVSAASADSGYMSAASTMHAHAYPMQRLVTPQPGGAAPGPHPAAPMTCGPVRVIYAPSHMPVHGSMHAPMVRMPSGGLAPPAQHSFPAAYFLHPMATPPGARPPAVYSATPHHSGPLSSMLSADMSHTAVPCPSSGGDVAPRPHPVAVPPGPSSPGLAWLPDAAPAVAPPRPPPPQKEVSLAEDAAANSSDEEFTLSFLHPADRRGAAAAHSFPAASSARVAPAAEERNPWEPAARGTSELLVRNSVFDSAPLEVLGCSMASGECGALDVTADDAAGSGGDIAASSCDECGLWFTPAGAPEDAVVGFSVDHRHAHGGDSSALLDNAIGSLVEAAHSEGFGDTVAQVTRTMTRVGCCLVQWHHKLQAAP